eukprot:7674933-Karenia_brevis.AAC.1
MADGFGLTCPGEDMSDGFEPGLELTGPFPDQPADCHSEKSAVEPPWFFVLTLSHAETPRSQCPDGVFSH